MVYLQLIFIISSTSVPNLVKSDQNRSIFPKKESILEDFIIFSTNFSTSLVSKDPSESEESRSEKKLSLADQGFFDENAENS